MEKRALEKRALIKRALLISAGLMVIGMTGCGSAGENSRRSPYDSQAEEALDTQAEEAEVETESEATITLVEQVPGTWTVAGLTVSGSYFSVEEAESTGDYSISNIYMIFKEGGAVYLSQDGNGTMGQWEISDDGNSLLVGNGVIDWDESTQQLIYEMDDNQMILYKLSDNQDITQIPAVKSAPDSEDKEALQESAKASADTPATSDSNTNSSDTVSPDFKESMDAYEAFFDEYVAFMKKYNSSSDQYSMLSDYLSMLHSYSETMEALEEVESEDLSDADMKYYLEVMTRIEEKLLDIY